MDKFVRSTRSSKQKDAPSEPAAAKATKKQRASVPAKAKGAGAGAGAGAAAAGAGGSSAFARMMSSSARKPAPKGSSAMEAAVPDELKALVHPSWVKVLAPSWLSPKFRALSEFVARERENKRVYPPADEVYQAMKLVAFEDVKVVILGQDPYHGPNQANGMAFSVKRGVPTPPSLRNMYKEISESMGIKPPSHGDLTHWGEQGVLLLNTVLTVEHSKANSHRKQGWEDVTSSLIRALNDRRENLVFMLWGKPAQTKAKMLNRSRHHVLEAPHPSPLSAHRGFFGCGHFAKANDFLTSKGLHPIDWAIPN